MIWNKFSNDTMPRRGELILVRNKRKIYNNILIVQSPTNYWEWDGKEYTKDYSFSGSKLSFFGIDSWMLIDSPY